LGFYFETLIGHYFGRYQKGGLQVLLDDNYSGKPRETALSGEKGQFFHYIKSFLKKTNFS
jgi:hypothetical protein